MFSLVLGSVGYGWANPLTLRGKSYATKTMETYWPFSEGANQLPLIVPGSLFLSVQPPPADDEKSAVARAAHLPFLEILSVNAHIGQHVNPGDTLFTYTLPLENRISDKETYSTLALDNMKARLSEINFQLAKSEIKQDEIKKGIRINTLPSSDEKFAHLNFESLLKEREALSLNYGLELKKYEDKVEGAQITFGKNFDFHNYPKTMPFWSQYAGNVLWINTNLVPGMVFTKKIKLIVVGNIDPIQVKAILYEMDLHKVKVGDKVAVTFDSIPNRTYASKIETIHYVSQTNDPQMPVYYEVDLYLDNHDTAIKEGMRCNVTLDAAAASQ